MTTTDAKPVQKKQALRILILWNHHEEASLASAEAGPSREARQAGSAAPAATAAGSEPAASAPATAAEPAAGEPEEAAPASGVAQAAAEPEEAAPASEPAASEGAAPASTAEPAASEASENTGAAGASEAAGTGRTPRQVTAITGLLRDQRHSVFEFDLEDDPGRVVDAVTVVRPSLIFNLVDSFYGDTTQHAAAAAYFDLIGVPYTGSDPLCLATCQDRVRTHLLLDDAGIPVPRFAAIRDVNAIPDTGDFRFPVIVTQAFDDVYEEEGEERPIHDRDELVEHCAILFKEFDLPYLVEEYIGERRLHAVVLGNRVLEVLPLVELSGEEEPASPWGLAQLDYDTADRVRQLARRAFRVMGCRDMAQIDFHLDEDDLPYVVDVRPMFEMGPGSAFWGAAEHTARGYAEVVADLVRIACRRVHIELDTPGAEPERLPDMEIMEPEARQAHTEPAGAAAGDEVATPEQEAELFGEEPASEDAGSTEPAEDAGDGDLYEDDAGEDDLYEDDEDEDDEDAGEVFEDDGDDGDLFEDEDDAYEYEEHAGEDGDTYDEDEDDVYEDEEDGVYEDQDDAREADGDGPERGPDGGDETVNDDPAAPSE